MRHYIWLLLALFGLAGCSGSNAELAEKLRNAVTEGEVGAEGYKTVQLAELTDFDWETMYYFQPNEDQYAISDAIGFKWEGPEVPENHRRLLFVSSQEVVSYVDYYYTDFPLFVYGCQGDRWVYPKSRSTFATFKYCNQEQEIYTFIPIACAEDIQELKAYTCPEKAASE